ncbi:autotransporter outer membrane beta-barrel domain-containing protein [Variovorax dokdonensis]|uniref:Autotransporter outer membrane beta-barrel domain-containing protein n=1 Tax=Variovorax dokdonensis TaxID=344883 RepID=A0ABT7N7Q8_9BURK|nr:autotransporter outer membrane beta-barrel domain-containing protein [Variovorax dokdonensis]MDM0043956.1 autotransporter outer membrane beta-barrel domain-containing protein [Variovorax dokdonensis]
MNKIHRIVWCAARDAWVAASEFSKGRSKGASRSIARALLGAAALCLASGGSGLARAGVACGDGSSPVAGVCPVGFNPLDHDDMAGATIADGAGQSVILRGSASDIALGNTGLVYPTFAELVPALNEREKLSLGAQVLGVKTPDPITGGSLTVATYDSARFSVSNWGTARADQYNNVGNGQYVGANMLSVHNGASGVVDIGDKTRAPAAAGNAISMAAKSTSIAIARGDGSSVDWASRNLIIFVAGYAPSGATSANLNVTVPVYAGTFRGFDGRSYTVTNVKELAAYNDVLVAALRAGKLKSQAAYDAAFNQAVSQRQESHAYSVSFSADDEITVPRGFSHSILVDGAGARGRILAGAQIDQRSATVGVFNGGRFEVERGGSMSSSGSLGLRLASGGTAFNNGVMSGGYYAENGWDTTRDGNYNGKYTEARLVLATDPGTTFTNNGIMNVAGWNLSTTPGEQYAVKLSAKAAAVNNGIINVDVANTASYGTTYGAIANGDAIFTNSPTGVIYMGRAAQYNAASPEAVVDTTNADNGGSDVGIRVTETARAVNEGRIVVGTLTQNAKAFLVANATRATAINSGTIEVNGRAPGDPLENIAMHAINSGSSVVLNRGTINLNGVNGVGIKVESSGGSSALAQTSGSINVAGGLDPGSGLRSYGVWADGSGSRVDVSGAVNLDGDGAIGVHARQGGTVAIATGGSVRFNDGMGQIGYFVHGPGSSIRGNGTTSFEVSTDESTLFRLEAGADYRAAAGSGGTLLASGERATAVVMTGATGSDVSAYNSGALNARLTGRNATAVRIEGGAQGKISTAAMVNLDAVGTVAGVVDGQKYGIDGAAVGDPVAGVLSDASLEAGAAGFGSGTLLVSGAALSSALDEVTGYIARNGAELANTGSIAFLGRDTTGIRVEAGARATNFGSITVNDGGTGIDAQDASGTLPTLVRTSGDMFLQGGSPERQTVGIRASGTQTVVRMTGGTMTLQGDGAAGVQAADGATVHVESGSTLAVEGNDARGLQVTGGAQATVAAGAKIELAGVGATAGIVDGKRYGLDGSEQATGTGSTLTNATAVSASHAGATGFVTQNQGSLVNTGSVVLAGANSQAVRVQSGQLNNAGNLTANGTAVYVEGADSSVTNSATILAIDGKAAVELGSGASLDLVGAGLGTLEARGSAHGVLVSAGAVGLTVQGAHIVVNAPGATGHGIENAAEIGNLQLNEITIDVADGIGLRTGASINNNNSGTIRVAGSGTGIALQNADGSQAANALDLSASEALNIKVSGAGGQGLVANTTGKVDSAVSVDVGHAAGGSALVLRQGVTEAINRGSLTSISALAPTVDAGAARRFTNARGGLIAASAIGDALALSDEDSEFVNQGRITGVVALGAGANSALLDNGSTLSGTLNGGSGDDLVTVRGNASFDAVDGVSGTDQLVFDGARYTYDDAGAIAHFDTVRLSNGAVVTIKQALLAADDGRDGSAIVIDGGSTLAVAATVGAFTLNNPLQGAGTVTTSSGGQSFDFGVANAGTTGADFTGTLSLGDTTFALKEQNTGALRNATLRAGEGSVSTVGEGEQRIGGLDIDGGTLRFAANLPDQIGASTTIAARTLDASHAGVVQVSVPAGYDLSPKDTPDRVNLLKQDDANIGTRLVSATRVTGHGGGLALQDQQGNAIASARLLDIAQGGETVARGSYDHRLSTAPGDGLYVNWGLTQLDLQQGRSLSLSQDSGATGAGADMSARVTGLGSLVVDAGAGTVSLSNPGNDYSGQTMVATGTLRLEADNALGKTNRLDIANAAIADLNGKTQTIGAFNGETNSTLDINGGALGIANGGISAGALKGKGRLNVAGGVLDVQGANRALAANTTIATGAEVRINDVAGLGSGAIDHQGVLTVDGAQGELVNAVSGAGDLVKRGGGTLSVGDSVRHSGTSRIEAGELMVGDAAHPARWLGAANAGEVTVAEGAVLTGSGTVSGHVTNEGTIRALNALPSQQAQSPLAAVAVKGTPTFKAAASAAQAVAPVLPNSTLTLSQGLVNRGLVQLAGPSQSAPGNVLHVKGNYVGEGARLLIRTVLADDASPTDKLVIEGGRASGSTAVIVQSAGGPGAPTMQGIRVVETLNGGTTASDAFHLDASSTGYRKGTGTLAAGAYDYNLLRGGNGGQAEDWYLTSDTESPGNATTPDMPEDTGAAATHVATDPGIAAPSAPSYRPEVGAYLANRAAARQMAMHTLRDRQGQAPGVDRDGQLPGKGAASDANGSLRVEGTNSQRYGVDPMSTVDGSSYLLHGGADLIRLGDGGEGSIRIGAMGMLGQMSSAYRNRRGIAQGQVDGYNLGAYGTWYGRQDILSGPYVDAWVMGGQYRSTVQGQGLARESYNATGVTASLEAGYAFKLLDDDRHQMYVEPQAQVIVSTYRASDHAEATGTVISGMDSSAVTTRLGVRVHGNTQDDVGIRQLRPFAELNWWHDGADTTMRFNGDVVRDALPSNRIEVKVGLQVNLSKQVSAWGALGGEVGSHGYRSGRIQAGAKYSW